MGKILNKFLILFLIIALITSGIAIYGIFLFGGIESLIRYIVMGLIALYDLRLILKVRKIVKGKTKKKPHKVLWLIWLILYAGICFAIGYALNFVYTRLSNVNKSDVTYTSYLVVLASNPTNDIKDAKNLTIGLLNDEKNPDGYIIPQEMIKKYKLQDNNEIKDYEDYTSMLADLYAKELNAMFVPSGYVSMFSNITGYENIETDTKIIGKASKTMKKANVSKVETASSRLNLKAICRSGRLRKASSRLIERSFTTRPSISYGIEVFLSSAYSSLIALRSVLIAFVIERLF